MYNDVDVLYFLGQLQLHVYTHVSCNKKVKSIDFLYYCNSICPSKTTSIQNLYHAKQKIIVFLQTLQTLI